MFSAIIRSVSLLVAGSFVVYAVYAAGGSLVDQHRSIAPDGKNVGYGEVVVEWWAAVVIAMIVVILIASAVTRRQQVR